MAMVFLFLTGKLVMGEMGWELAHIWDTINLLAIHLLFYVIIQAEQMMLIEYLINI